MAIDLPTVGYVAGFAAATGLAVKYIPQLFSKGGENGFGEWRGRVQGLLESNIQLCQSTSQLVTVLVTDVRRLNDIVEEIERRTRNAEEGFRDIGEVADTYQTLSLALAARVAERAKA